jgi:hypothetical protein
MVFAVQCPNPKCRKYQLVEEHERNKVVHCLLCKTAIRIGGSANQGQNQAASPGQSKPKP